MASSLNSENLSHKPEDCIDAKSCPPTKELINGIGDPGELQDENPEPTTGIGGDETDAKPAVIGENVVAGAKVPAPFTDKDSLYYNIKG